MVCCGRLAVELHMTVQTRSETRRATCDKTGDALEAFLSHGGGIGEAQAEAVLHAPARCKGDRLCYQRQQGCVKHFKTATWVRTHAAGQPRSGTSTNCATAQSVQTGNLGLCLPGAGRGGAARAGQPLTAASHSQCPQVATNLQPLSQHGPVLFENQGLARLGVGC
jgi:hypothetical protein